MTHLPLTELIQYVEEHVEFTKPITIEAWLEPSDTEPTLMDFSSKHEFFTYCIDLAGTLSIMDLNEIRARIL